MLDLLGMSEALVYHASAHQYDASFGNEALSKELAFYPRLHPCWVVQPHHTGEMPDAQALVTRMLESGIRAARLFPRQIGPLRPYVYGPLFAALADRAVPLLLDFELGHYSTHMDSIDWDGLDWALGTYRRLPITLVRPGQAIDRMLLPFMERHENLYVETSYYIGGGALERLGSRFGAERLLFGTGMPLYAPGPAITLLTYSGLDEEAKRLVGGDNLRHLLNQVQQL
jgi:predicted TIM-barrel fold metal-dependent hydrolase